MASPPPPPAPTTITDLSEDLLRAIFLRLPSLPSLIHAAYSHPAFRNAARSSRAFRRSFSELHPPDVLAFFSAKHMKVILTSPSHSPWRRSDPDLLAADFLQLDRPSNGCWEIKTSDPDYKGYLCLINPSGGLAPYNPVTQALKIFVPAPTPQDRVATQGIEFLTLACDDDPKSSRVLLRRPRQEMDAHESGRLLAAHNGVADGRWMMSKEFPLRPILKELAEDYSVEEASKTKVTQDNVVDDCPGTELKLPETVADGQDSLCLCDVHCIHSAKFRMNDG
ncbi:hypothetical protein D1007_23813 [Hordeum vulgare]|nr:hypothetical protein D1007_23813 [Hordeum vulgare]